MTFSEWWMEHPIHKSNGDFLLKLAFEGTARQAWTAAHDAVELDRRALSEATSEQKPT